MNSFGLPLIREQAGNFIKGAKLRMIQFFESYLEDI